MVNEYNKGQKVKLSGTFTVAESPTDPTGVMLKLKNPAGEVTSYTYAAGEITKTDTGDYEKEISADLEGVYHYGFIGTGAVSTARFAEFVVRAWPFS